jgi:hypothetical protein
VIKPNVLWRQSRELMDEVRKSDRVDKERVNTVTSCTHVGRFHTIYRPRRPLRKVEV